VQFTSTDGQAVLPSNYPFTGGDAGVRSFAGTGFTLKTTPSQTITVKDTVQTGIAATTSAITVNPGALSAFTLTGAPASATAGTSFGAGVTITVTAKDAYNNVKTDYAGTVQFTSTDGQAVLPANYAFTGGDAGVHAFAGTGFTLKTTPSQTLTVKDTVQTGIAATTGAITVNPGALDHFTVTGVPASVTAGTSFGGGVTVTVTAYDAYNNRKTDYAGTVQFYSSDAQAVLPSNYAFVGGDSGQRGFAGTGFTLKTTPSQTVSAKDTVQTSKTGTSAAVTVNAAAAASVKIRSASNNGGVDLTGQTTPLTTGQTLTIWAAGYDAYGNYAGDQTASWSQQGGSGGCFSLSTASGTSTTVSWVGACAAKDVTATVSGIPGNQRTTIDTN
jgi:hypothetical protein